MTALSQELTPGGGDASKHRNDLLHRRVMRTTILKDILYNILFNVAVALILIWAILGCPKLG